MGGKEGEGGQVEGGSLGRGGGALLADITQVNKTMKDNRGGDT